MSRKISIRSLALIALLAVLAVGGPASAAPDAGMGVQAGGCMKCGGGGNGGGVPPTPLNDTEKAALDAAIHEEYLALNTYQTVIAQFGALAPFSMITRSEQSHANAVGQLFTKYGFTVPSNPGLPSSAPNWWPNMRAACQRGVDVEIDDIALYDRLLPTVQHGDVIQVFTNLRSASLNHHLPAFEACN